MNLFSNFSLRFLTGFAVLFLFSQQSGAVYVEAMYTAACQREIGISLKVTEMEVYFLNLNGKVISVPKHQIIYMAQYPMDGFPSTSLLDISTLPSFKIYTRDQGRIQFLLQGWPVNYSQDKISFLTVEGSEVLVDRQSIESLTEEVYKQKIKIQNRASFSNLEFVHPYVFRECPSGGGGKAAAGGSGKNLVYPEQVLSDAFVIKKELDRRKEGYAGVERYLREQRFYAKPFIYPEFTSLGLWHSFGSRYGASQKRNNNLMPNLVDRRASDLFDYQQIFITGSAPMDYSIHEEPQAQATFAFKASYFHFHSMLDPNLFLVGKSYNWSENDLQSLDVRMNDSSIFEMGFDAGHFSLLLFITNGVPYAVKVPDFFVSEIIHLPRVGLQYLNHDYSFQYIHGEQRSTAFSEDLQRSYGSHLSFQRLNVGLTFLRRWELKYSFILRSFDLDQILSYSSQSQTHFVQAVYDLSKRFQVGGFASLENLSQKYSYLRSGSQNDNFFKWGGYLSLKF